MADTFHDAINPGDIHGIVNLTYPDGTNRAAGTNEGNGITVTSDNVYDIAHQTDNDSFWILMDAGPPLVWIRILTSGGAGTTIDDAYNNYGTNPATVFVDDNEGQGDLKFELQGAVDLVVDLENTLGGYGFSFINGAAYVNFRQDGVDQIQIYGNDLSTVELVANEDINLLADDQILINSLTGDAQFGSTNDFARIFGTEIDLVNTDGVVLSSISNPSYEEGKFFYDSTAKSMAYYNEESDVTANVCRESLIRVYNNSGGTITNGKVVYIDNASSGWPTIQLADATEFNKSRIIGMVTHDIENATYGYVTQFGNVNDVDTSGKTLGAICYLDPASPGDCTENRPTGGNFPVIVGVITAVNASTGRIFILPNISQYTTETVQITGWADIQQYNVAFTNGTRTLDLTSVGSEYRWYEMGVKYTKVSDSVVITDVEGLHIIYYNAGTLTVVANPTQTQVDSIIRNYATVAYVYWDQTNQECLYLGYESHTIGMPTYTHNYLHFTRGAQYISGLEPTNIIADDTGSLDAHAQFGVDAGVCADEDVPFFPVTVASTTGLPIYYLDGTEAAPVVRSTTNVGFSIDTAGTGRMAYNFLTGGNWTVAEVTNGYFALCHVFATNDAVTTRRTMSFMGQDQYSSLAAAREGALVEISNLILGELVSPELVPVATLIFETKNTYPNAVKSRIRTTLAGNDFIDWRTSPPAVGSGSGTVSPVFSDADFKVFDDADPTKEMIFQLSGIATGTTRTMSIPDDSLTLVGVNVAGLFDVDATTVDIDATGNIDVDTASGNITLTADDNNGSGSVIISALNNDIDIDAADDVLIDAGGLVSIDASETIDFSGTNASLTTAGALAIANDFTLTGGGSIRSTSNGDITIEPNGTGNLGIGTSAPDRIVHISSSDTSYLRLENLDTTGSVGQEIGVIEFEGQDTGGTGVRAYLSAIYEGTSGATAITLGTMADGVGSPSEHFRINRNGNMGVGTSTPSYKLSIGSADNSDQVGIYHDNTDAYIKWTDGSCVLQTDEGTDTNTYLDIKGKGTGLAFHRLYDEDKSERLEMYCTAGIGIINTAGVSPNELLLQETAHANVTCFQNAASGETKEFQIYGYRAADALRSLQIGVGIDAADTASFDGVSNYLFDGAIITQNGSDTDTFEHDGTDAKETISSGGRVTYHESPVSLADDASFDLPSPTGGFCELYVYDTTTGSYEYAHFRWENAGTVTLISNTANVVNTDTDTNLCVFNNSGTVRVRNRLGGTRLAMFDYHYTDIPVA